MTELCAIKPSRTARTSWLMLMSRVYVFAALSIFCIVVGEVLSARARTNVQFSRLTLFCRKVGGTVYRMSAPCWHRHGAEQVENQSGRLGRDNVDFILIVRREQQEHEQAKVAARFLRSALAACEIRPAGRPARPLPLRASTSKHGEMHCWTGRWFEVSDVPF